MDEWLDERVAGCMDKWMDEWINSSTGMDAWMDGWVVEWTETQMDGWINEWISQLVERRPLTLRCASSSRQLLVLLWKRQYAFS
jgi:hypothetical protein